MNQKAAFIPWNDRYYSKCTYFHICKHLGMSVKRFDEKWGLKKWEVTSVTALPFVTAFGLISFCLFLFALWPIWSFLTLPLLFTLFMACMVITPFLIFGNFRPQYDELRAD